MQIGTRVYTCVYTHDILNLPTSVLVSPYGPQTASCVVCCRAHMNHTKFSRYLNLDLPVLNLVVLLVVLNFSSSIIH